VSQATPAPSPAGGAGSGLAVGAAVACYSLWGLMPLVFVYMGGHGIGSWEVVAERCAWSFLWAGALVVLSRQRAEVMEVLRSPRTVFWLAVSSLTIGVNWTLFVWAVNQGHTLETSLGYYLNPLLNMAVGAVLFRERLSRASVAAVVLAGIGVILQALALGRMPWVGLTLAASFCTYGVIRKKVAAGAQTGLFVECLVLAVPGVVATLWLEAKGLGNFGASPVATLLLLSVGPVTVIPLVLFAWAARRMPLSTLGFIQFIGPTLQFFVALGMGDRLSTLRAVSFLFVWAGVAVFSWSAFSQARLKAAQRQA
jgi:chloramphenicol-sensitive protein RarD